MFFKIATLATKQNAITFVATSIKKTRILSHWLRPYLPMLQVHRHTAFLHPRFLLIWSQLCQDLLIELSNNRAPDLYNWCLSIKRPKSPNKVRLNFCAQSVRAKTFLGIDPRMREEFWSQLQLGAAPSCKENNNNKKEKQHRSKTKTISTQIHGYGFENSLHIAF